MSHQEDSLTPPSPSWFPDVYPGDVVLMRHVHDKRSKEDWVAMVVDKVYHNPDTPNIEGRLFSQMGARNQQPQTNVVFLADPRLDDANWIAIQRENEVSSGVFVMHPRTLSVEARFAKLAEKIEAVSKSCSREHDEEKPKRRRQEAEHVV